MRERDLQILEFDKVLSLLADRALSSAGREASLALRPQTATERVTAESERTWQFLHLLAACPAFPLRPFPDIRPALQWAAHAGAALEGQKLHEILEVIALSRTLAAFLRDTSRDYGQLIDFPARLLAFPELEEILNRCLESNGQLKDEASSELSMLRHRLRALVQEIERRLQHLLHTPELREVVAEHYVTMRNNRFVIPVRASRHTRVPGVVQDRSGSGETVFLEPLFAVELNNRVLLTKKEEEAEERRVLLWLTSLVRREGPQLENVFATLSEIDVLQAKVRLARQYHGSKPRLGGTEVRLRAARHPLLLASGKPVVPIDLLVPEGKSGLIVSGPNTGGKTVALKTLGLLCLMAQSGFLLPVAEDSCLPIFHGIFADIGDPQSLEQSLSTFAAHMQNLADILRDLSVPALVLFDEPGGGTDPGEGGALACGILTYLKTCGVMVAAATHLTPVKLFALTEGSYQVSAVEFELETLTPHYRLHYDTIGQSLGLSMARRLGVPEPACAAAETLLSHEARQLSQATAKLEELRTSLEHDRTLAAAEREQAAALRLQQQALVAELEEKTRLAQAALTEARLLVQRLRQEGRACIATLQKRSGVTPAEQHQARVELAHLVHQHQEAIKTQEQALPPVHATDHALLRVGDEVEVPERKIRGELIAVQGDRVRIRHGSLTFEVPAAQVHKSAEKKVPL